jgi:thiol-disulfide isomerase/thioredoxin
MTNQQRSKHRGKPSTSVWLWVGVAVAVVVAGLIAILSSRGSDASDQPDGVAQNQPVTVVGTALPAVDDFTNDPAIGTKAPVLEGLSFDGTPVTIDPADGPVMVVFLAHWCPHCNAEIPRLLSWQTAGGIPADLRIIGVSTAVVSSRDNYPPSEWVVKKAWAWPVMADSAEQTAARAYGVSGYPYFTIVGKDGLVKLRASGEIEVADLDRLVDQALAS